MSNSNSTPINYPYWAGRLSAALDMMLEESSSSIVAEIRTDLAKQVRDEYEQVTGRTLRRQPREQQVPCKVCTTAGPDRPLVRHFTFNLDRIHDDCRVAEAVSA